MRRKEKTGRLVIDVEILSYDKEDDTYTLLLPCGCTIEAKKNEFGQFIRVI